MISSYLKRRICRSLYKNLNRWAYAKDLCNGEDVMVYNVAQFLRELHDHKIVLRIDAHRGYKYRLESPYWTLSNIESEMGWQTANL